MQCALFAYRIHMHIIEYHILYKVQQLTTTFYKIIYFCELLIKLLIIITAQSAAVPQWPALC